MTVTPVERLIAPLEPASEPALKGFSFEELFYLTYYRCEIFYGLGIFEYLKLLVNIFFKKPSVENFYLVTQRQFSTKTSAW